MKKLLTTEDIEDTLKEIGDIINKKGGKMKILLVMGFMMIGCYYHPTGVQDIVYKNVKHRKHGHSHKPRYNKHERYYDLHKVYYKNWHHDLPRHSKYKDHDIGYPHRKSYNHGRHW